MNLLPLGLGALFECLAAIWLIGNPADTNALALALLLHLSAAASFALAHLGRRPGLQTLSILLLAALLPVVGVCLFHCLRLDPQPRAPRVRRDWRPIPNIDPHHRRLRLENPPSGAALQGILRHNPSVAERVKAVDRSATLPPLAARAVLQTAMRDSDEIVRQRAFSRLDGRREQVDQELGTLLELMEREPQSVDDTRVQAEAADRLWEMAYQGLADSSSLPTYLRRANRHLQRALDDAPDEPDLHYRRARILLKQGEPSAAQRAFARAADLGQSRDDVLPYLAECAFDLGQYAQVPTLLAQLSPVKRRSPMLAELGHSWGVRS